jgi:sugar phosphate permease
MLRAAPAIGGMSVALYLGAFPMRSRVGSAMFATVALFAVAIIVFGLSTVLWISVVALIVMGGADMASVYIRWTLVQLWTPDHVRGRVSAVTGVSASGSTELGDFRAGVSAALIGPVAAVVLGGVTILAVVALWMRLFPELAGISSLSRAESDGKEQ